MPDLMEGQTEKPPPKPGEQQRAAIALHMDDCMKERDHLRDVILNLEADLVLNRARHTAFDVAVQHYAAAAKALDEAAQHG